MDYIGNLYTKVANYLWNGSETLPQVKGIKDYGVKSNNFIRWDNELAEARYSRKHQVQPADMPEVELRMTSIRPALSDMCHVVSEVNFVLTVASGNWKITNATKLYNQIMVLLAVLVKSNELCHWDIGKPNAIVEIAKINDGQVGEDREIRKNQPGFTFEVGLAVRIITTPHHTGE